MKKLSTLFSIVGFAIQFVAPVLLFGDVIPYTKEQVGKCLTGMAYVAGAVLLFFALKKVKEWLLQKPKSILRGILLSLPSVFWWVAIFLALDYVRAFTITLTEYWVKVIYFVVVGRICYIISEALEAEEGVKE